MTDDMSRVMEDTPLEDIPNRVFIDRIRAWRIVRETGVKPARPPEPPKPEVPDGG